jgi:hypothetical protein
MLNLPKEVMSMPGTARQKSETAIYHIWLRGINRQRIFEETAGGVAAVSAFQRLNRNEQRNAVTELHQLGLSIRQLAGMTGFSKGLVEKWLKK